MSKTVRLVLLLLLGVWLNPLFAQHIVDAEYYINEDPGVGNGTPIAITATDDLNETFDIPVAGLEPGFHILYIRTQNDSGEWGLSEARSFYVIPPAENTSRGENIAGGEYFFDSDPGVGNGMPLQLDETNDLVTTEQISITGLEPGFHNLYVRLFDAKGQATMSEARSFLIIEPSVNQDRAFPIVGGEYFFDSDKGVGTGTYFEFNDTAKSLVLDIPLTDIPAGFHNLYIRLFDERGQASMQEARSFYVTKAVGPQTEAPKLIALEYALQYEGEEPMYDRTEFQPADAVMETFLLDFTDYPEGHYSISYRAVDEAGNVGFWIQDTFNIFNYGLANFSLPDVQIDSTVVFDMESQYVYIEVDPTADITNYIPELAFTTGSRAYYGNEPVVAGQTAFDFSAPVELSVLTASGDGFTWNIEVYQRPQSSEAELSAIGLAMGTGEVYEFEVRDDTSFVAEINSVISLDEVYVYFEVSDYAELELNGAFIESGSQALTSPWENYITVYAEDGTTQEYTLVVEQYEDELNHYSSILYNIDSDYANAIDLVENVDVYTDEEVWHMDMYNLPYEVAEGEVNDFAFDASWASANGTRFAKIALDSLSQISNYAHANLIFSEKENLSSTFVDTIVKKASVGEFFLAEIRRGYGYAVLEVTDIHKTLFDDDDNISFAYHKVYAQEDNSPMVEYIDYEWTNPLTYEVTLEAIEYNGLWFEWDIDSDGVVDFETESPSLDLQFEEPGTFAITLVSTNQFGTDTAYLELYIEQDTPDCSVLDADYFETTDTITIEAYGGSGDYVYYFEGKDSSLTGIFTNLESGIFYIEVVDQISGCYVGGYVEVESKEDELYVYTDILDEILYEIEEENLIEAGNVSEEDYNAMVDIFVTMDSLVENPDTSASTYETVLTEFDEVVEQFYTNSQILEVRYVDLPYENLSVGIGDEPFALDVTFSPSEPTFSTLYWYSDDKTVIDVIDGVVYPVAPGTATVYVEAIFGGEDAWDYVDITVENELLDLTLQPSISLLLDESSIVNYRTVPENMPVQLSWYSADTTIVKVDERGKVKAVSEGTTIITAYSEEWNLSASTMVTVSSEIPELTALKLGEDIMLKPGERFALQAKPVPANAVGVPVWSTSDPAIANVNEYGVVKANAVGVAVITVEDEVTGVSAELTVKVLASEAPAITEANAVNIASEDSVFTIPLSAFVSDDNTPTGLLQVETVSAENVTVETSAGILVVSPNEDWVGEETVVLSVTDVDGNETLIEIDVAVSADENMAPELKAVPSQTIVSGGAFTPINCEAYVWDDFTPAQNIMWSVEASDNLSASLSGSILTVSVDVEGWTGAEEITVTATDAKGLSSFITIVYAVSDAPNEAPEFLWLPVAELSASGEAVVDLQYYIVDDYTLPAKMTWSLDAPSQLNANIQGTRLYVELADEYWSGSKAILLTATDAGGLSAEAELTVVYESTEGNDWTGKPIVEFSAENTKVAPGSPLRFFSSITGADSWKWEFEVGTADNAFGTSPLVTYDNAGTFTVTLMAENENGVTTVTMEDYISVIGIVTPDTAVCSGETVDLVATTGLDAYAWSTTDEVASVSILAEATQTYIVTITDGFFEFVDSVTVTVTPPLELGADEQIFCANDFPSLSVSGYTEYNWNNLGFVEAQDRFTVDQAGTLTLTVIDEAGCEFSDEVTFVESEVPDFAFGADTAICAGTSIDLEGLDGVDTYAWSTGDDSQTISVDEAGVYTLTVSQTGGCSYADSIEISILEPHAEELALVTYSSESPSVIVAWEYTAGKRTAYYEVHRETGTANNWELVGTVGFGELTYYVDTEVNATQQAYRYKLLTYDSVCNNVAESATHRTMHLVKSPSLIETQANLEWSGYVGLNVGSYKILALENGAYSEVGSVPAEEGREYYSFVYNDHAPGKNYRVVFDLPKTIALSTLKSDSGPYSQSLSNLAEAIIVSGVDVIDSGAITVSPNPVSEETVITYPDNETITSARIVNLNGQTVQEVSLAELSGTVDLSTLSPGTYVLELVGVHTYQVLIVKP